MKIETHECDICHKQRQKANHWWRAYLLDTRTSEKGIVILPWSDSPISEAFAHTVPKSEAHLCGEACLHEWLSKNLPAS